MLLLILCAGSGRVTFNNQRSYLKAVCAAFVEIKTPKFTKKVRTHRQSAASLQKWLELDRLSEILLSGPPPPQVQIDPYLEDSMCQVCLRQPGPFFCRDQVSGNFCTPAQCELDGWSQSTTSEGWSSSCEPDCHELSLVN